MLYIIVNALYYVMSERFPTKSQAPLESNDKKGEYRHNPDGTSKPITKVTIGGKEYLVWEICFSIMGGGGEACFHRLEPLTEDKTTQPSSEEPEKS